MPRVDPRFLCLVGNAPIICEAMRKFWQPNYVILISAATNNYSIHEGTVADNCTLDTPTASKVAPYFFPFVLEYSLIAMSIMVGIYQTLNVRGELCTSYCWFPKNNFQLNVTGKYQWLVNIVSHNCLVPSGNKPFPEPMLNQIYIMICNVTGNSLVPVISEENSR